MDEDAPLYGILNEFQKGHSHMAVVVKYNKEKAESIHQVRKRQFRSHRSSKTRLDGVLSRLEHFFVVNDMRVECFSGNLVLVDITALYVIPTLKPSLQ